MTHDEMIAVIAAHRDGKSVQFRRSSVTEKNDDLWVNNPDPAWDFEGFEYRVELKPKE